MKYNYYHYFLFNIKSLVNNFGYIPHWIDLNEEKFMNHSGHSHTDFNTKDKFLQQYSKEKMGLGKDIIKNGTYAPFFFYNDIKNNKKKLYLGKHRLYSLLLCKKEQVLPRDFLFLESPIDPLLYYENELNRNEIRQGKIYEWQNTNSAPILKTEMSLKDVAFTVLVTGDTLSNWLFENNIKPSNIINNKEEFERFIKEPFTLPLEM